jgi:tetratricopeptide (TPR) repeat protein
MEIRNVDPVHEEAGRQRCHERCESLLKFASLLFVGMSAILPTRTNAFFQNLSDQDASVNSRNLLEEGRTFLAEGKTDQAEGVVRAFLARHQNSAGAHFLLGLILFRQIQADALEGRADAGNDTASEVRGNNLREKNARASLAEYTEGAKYARPSASDLKVVALDYVLLGSYADASKWLARSVEENPKDPEAWYYLGRSRYNENRFEEAIKAFLRCLEFEPRNIKAQSNLGLSYAGLNRISDAEDAYRKAIDWQAESSVKTPEPYIDFGDLLIQQNRLREAVTYLTTAAQIAPRESRAREKLGSAYLNLNELPAAQEQLELAVARDPRSASSHYLLGSVYRKQGQTEKARAEFERFQKLKESSGKPQP